MVNYQRLSKPMALSALLYLGMLINPLSAFNISPSQLTYLTVGGAVYLGYTNLDSQPMNMDVKLAVLNSNNVLDVIATIAANDTVGNNILRIYNIPNNILEGSNYFFIAQVSGGSSYAESGPHNIPKKYNSFANPSLPSVSAATILETFPLDIPTQTAVAQASSPSSTTGSATTTPTIPSDSLSSNTKTSSAIVTPTSSEKTSNNGSSITSKGASNQHEIPFVKSAIIAIAVVIPLVTNVLNV